MSIRLLHPDARALLAQATQTTSDNVALGERMLKAPTWVRDHAGVPADFNTTVEELRSYRDQFQSALQHPSFWEASRSEPGVFEISYEDTKGVFGRKITGIILVYQGAFYSITGPYTHEEAKLILMDSITKKKRKAEYLTARQNIAETEQSYTRYPVLEATRNEVWRRDQGRCAQCSSVRNLEFDHIVPVSKGGANTARNIQLLCENCNRRKGNNIG